MRDRDQLGLRTHLERGGAQLHALCRALRLGAETERISGVFEALLSPWGERPIGPAPAWPSDIGDDHSPLEFSIALGGKLPELRVLVEPQVERPSLGASWEAGWELCERLARDFGADLGRLYELRDLFEPRDGSALFAMWHAASFWPGRAPEFKVYLNLQARGKGEAAAILEEALARLGIGGAYPRFAEAALRRGPALDELKYFSLDLASHDRARVKVYAQHRDATADELERVMCAAGGGAGDVRTFCRELLGGEGPYAARPFASCLAFVGGERPWGGTLYAPVGYYADHDGEVRERLLRFLAAQGLPVDDYERALAAVASRPLEAGAGLHSYASFKREDGRPKVTLYFACEAYRVFSAEELRARRSRPPLAPPEEIVARYEQESISSHPLFRRLEREPVDLGRLWVLLANGYESISRQFPRLLASVVARVDDDRIRSVLAKQLNDELGDGDPSRAHRLLFEDMLARLAPFRPSADEERLFAPGRRLAEGLLELYTARPALEGVGATMVIEIFGRQADQSVGELFRRQRALDPASLTWLNLHEELEVEHASESLDLARLLPREGEGLREGWRGAEALAALAWRYFDELYELLSGPLYPDALARAAAE